MIAAGAIFVGGALGLEMIQATIVEEAAEMLGAILFLYALLAYLAVHRPVRVEVADGPSRESRVESRE